jgi:hypothetical protein
MQFNPNLEVVNLDGDPIQIDGQTLKIGDVIIQSVLCSHGTPEVKKGLWETAKIIHSACSKGHAVTIPNELTAKIIKDAIWAHPYYGIDVLGSTSEILELELSAEPNENQLDSTTT